MIQVNIKIMESCPKCNRIVAEEWDFCTYCGQELVHETSNAFAYDQLFELMKLEEARRSYLDSKASTYIGLLSIAVTVLTAFGGALTIREGQIQEIKNPQIVISSLAMLIMYILYFFIIIVFILGVIFAFRAYITGSIKTSPDSEKKNMLKKLAEELCSLIPKKLRSFFQIDEIDVFQGMDIDYIAKYSDIKLLEMRKDLIYHLKDITSNNYNLNNLKSDRIISAYRVTILGILLLLLLSLIVGLIGIGNP